MISKQIKFSNSYVNFRPHFSFSLTLLFESYRVEFIENHESTFIRSTTFNFFEVLISYLNTVDIISCSYQLSQNFIKSNASNCINLNAFKVPMSDCHCWLASFLIWQFWQFLFLSQHLRHNFYLWLHFLSFIICLNKIQLEGWLHVKVAFKFANFVEPTILGKFQNIPQRLTIVLHTLQWRFTFLFIMKVVIVSCHFISC